MLAEILKDYLKIFPEERPELKLLLDQVRGAEALNDRRNFRGHITGSAIILSPDKKKVLLIHHNFFKLWQQPGGHWETDEPDPFEAARREALEETGVEIAKALSIDPKHPLVPLDINSHAVPARPAKDEPPHFHHDFRYVFMAANEKLAHQAAEVSAAAWYVLGDPTTSRVSRCIEKLHRFKFV